MKSLQTILLIILSSICTITKGQTTEEFNKIDAKYSFKDIVFGTSFSLLKTKMGLKKTGTESSPNQYTITNKKYLSIGEYIAMFGDVVFSKNKLLQVGLNIDLSNGLKFEEILKYFSYLFGEPEYIDEVYWWQGKKIIYSLQKEMEINSAQICILSNLIKYDKGLDNF